MGSISSTSSYDMTTVSLETDTSQGSASDHRSVEITSTSTISAYNFENNAVNATSLTVKIIQICKML